MSNDRDIRISAVLPAYNAEKYISRALDSVLKQTRPADEIIVIDDGSTDSTAEIIKGYGDKIRYVYQDNGGESAARNRGVQEASCEWIAFLDSDDEWLEHNLELLAGLVCRNKNLVWAFGNFINCDYSTEKRWPAFKEQIPKALLGGSDFFSSYLKCFNAGFNVCSINHIIKKSVYEDVGLYALGQKRGADTDMWLRIAYKYPQIGYVRKPLAIYHRGIAESMTSSHRDFDIITEMVDKHLKLSKENGLDTEFIPCASMMLRVWIRDMLSTGHTDGLIETIEHFDKILPKRFKQEMRLRVKHPCIAKVCLPISGTIKKCLKLCRSQKD